MSHATLAPSAAERWIQCPASVRMSKDAPRHDSVYAQEGTRAHVLGALVVGYYYGLITFDAYEAGYDQWQLEATEAGDNIGEMQTHIHGYLDLVKARVARYPMSQVLVEQRMRTGVPSCWGTSDVVIVSPEHVEIIDLKYGAGVPVSAEENPQLRLYALGALDTFGMLLGTVGNVYATVYQPRLNSTSTETLTAEELREWRKSILSIAKEALGDDAHFAPSATACRWCPAAGTCRARVQKMTQEDFGRQPDSLTPAELGQLLERIPDIREWCSAVTDTALKLAHLDETEIPGWKVVLSNGRRVVEDQAHAIQILIDAGYRAEQVARPSLRKLGDLDREVGAVKLQELLGSLLVKTTGNPSLVPASDPRPALSPNTEAAKDFSGGTE